MLMGFTRNISSGIYYTGSMAYNTGSYAGGALYFGASTVASGANVVARNVSATAKSSAGLVYTTATGHQEPIAEIDQEELLRTESLRKKKALKRIVKTPQFLKNQHMMNELDKRIVLDKEELEAKRKIL